MTKNLKENTKADNLVFIEDGSGYLLVFEKGNESIIGNHEVGKRLFEIDYDANNETFCLTDFTVNGGDYYIDMISEDTYNFIANIEKAQSYEEIIKLIKKNNGYKVDYDKFGKEIRTYLETVNKVKTLCIKKLNEELDKFLNQYK